MKISVVYDNQGTVISVHEMAPTSAADTPQYGVTLQKGHRAASLEVPARLQAANLLEIVSSVRVDVTRAPHALSWR